MIYNNFKSKEALSEMLKYVKSMASILDFIKQIKIYNKGNSLIEMIIEKIRLCHNDLISDEHIRMEMENTIRQYIPNFIEEKIKDGLINNLGDSIE